MELIRKFTPEQFETALSSWNWLPIEGKEPFLANALGDVFFTSAEGIHFLDKIDGTLLKLCNTKEELQSLLNTKEGQETYLWSPIIQALSTTELHTEENEVFDFEINPILGGEIDLPNITTSDFVVATNLAGQIHEKVKDLPEGTSISNIKINEI